MPMDVERKKSNSKPNTTKSVVAFLDILGAGSLIKGDVNESLNVVHQCYEFVCNEIGEIYNESLPVPQISIFSDNIVLSLPCENLSEENQLFSFFSIIAYSAIMISYFWNKGLLIRGGISIGSFFSDDLMVWGEGLTKAYYLESHIAIYPRVVVDPKYYNLFQTACEPFKFKILCDDFDGLQFVDPFYKTTNRNHELIKKFIKENVDRINKCKKEDIKIIQKLLWLQNYFEEKLSEN